MGPSVWHCTRKFCGISLKCVYYLGMHVCECMWLFEYVGMHVSECMWLFVYVGRHVCGCMFLCMCTYSNVWIRRGLFKWRKEVDR